MMDTHQEAIWDCLLSLNEQLALQVKEISLSQDIAYCTLQFGETSKVVFNEDLPPATGTETIKVVLKENTTLAGEKHPLFIISEDLSCRCHAADTLDRHTIDFLQLYLPYCFLPVFAQKYHRAIAIAHFAQTLDGKIAACNGNSKWIGNTENLVHAHRMRALCDGIIVGANTVDKDHPRLTVRHVEGKNPSRIIVSSSTKNLDSLFNTEDAPVWIIGSIVGKPSENCQYINLQKNENGKISPKTILKKLYQKGICSVYIEGGPRTTSNFLNERALDIVQLHISPLILGSGMPGFALPPVEDISQSVHFSSFTFHPIGDTYMFVGTPKAG